MSFGPTVLAFVETVLADGFQYHRQLDAFLRRSGLSEEHLRNVRREADSHNKSRSRPFDKAAKRDVARAFLEWTDRSGDSGARLLAAVIGELVKLPINAVDQTAHAALVELKNQISIGRESARQDRKRGEEEASRIRLEQSRSRETSEGNRSKLLGRFFDMERQSDSQARGYALEKILYDLFSLEKLDPKASFKVVGEQIDGSFAWGNQTVLLEAKWQKSPVDVSAFGAFSFKIEGKSADTRGLLVSVNGLSELALKSLQQKGTQKFVCMDGAHLVRALQAGQSFHEMLVKLMRHLAETGIAYLPVSDF